METTSWIDVRPAAGLIRRYRELGFWRDATPAADVRRWAAETPHAIAITAHRAGAGVVRMSYREYAGQVDRMAAVLAELGIGPGQTVAVQLPSWWEANAVMLACARLGATFAPLDTRLRAREIELMLARLQPVAYVTTEVWQGYEHSAALAAIADHLPSIKHRIIVGGRVRPDEIDLARRAERADVARLDPGFSAEDPDRVSVVLFTSGTTGAPKAVLHSFNTYYAGYAGFAASNQLSSSDVLYCPHALAHVLSQCIVNLIPVCLGAEALITDTWAPETAVDLLARYGVSYTIAAPVFIEAIARTARASDRELPRLRTVAATATTVPLALVDTVSDNLGLTLQGAWGMTEVGPGAATSPSQDPLDWAARSIGKPIPCMETSLLADGEISPHKPARLLVRGANVCLATMPRDGGEVTIVAEQDEDWYETGDLVFPDGRDGLRMAGRAVDRIGLLMIPAADVEDALRTHPDIIDAALVGYGPGSGLPCAVVTSRKPVTLAEVRAYLDSIAMTEWYQPKRLELLDQLPRNANGKVDKLYLRTWLSGYSGSN
jgi:cyclohexanecarboxylate-CoA ligase